MIRVAFLFDAPLGYTGGLNYLKNLLHALSTVNDGKVKPYLFFSTEAPDHVTAPFEPYAEVVRTPILRRKTWPWFVHKVLYKAFGSMAMVNRLMKKHRIDVVSHAWYVYKGQPPVKVIAWIPDFQYLHLPELFPNLDPAQETVVNEAIISHSDLTIVSSAHAYEDFHKIAREEHRERGRILRFVCQPSAAPQSGPDDLARLESRYGFNGPYFILPNQFWAHKNHQVVVEAVGKLKKKGIAVQVLCTGNTKDYRLEGTPYIDGLRKRIAELGLENQVRILGMIDYGDLLLLMRHAIALINPSRFEGWSSSVEEARSMGKATVLSSIPVHLEQAPPGARYFGPDDADELAGALAQLAAGHDPARQAGEEALALAQLKERTLAFGQQYLELLQRVQQPTTTRRTG